MFFKDEVDDNLTVEMDSIEAQNNSPPTPQPRNIISTPQEQFQSASISSRIVVSSTTLTSTTTFSSTTTRRLDPNVVPSSFNPQAPHLSLRRDKPAFTINTAGSTLPGYGSRDTGSGQLRLGGITQYPVMTPTPPGFSPYLPPGRKTSFIDYSNPKNL